METVDDILGPSETVDSILGPEATVDQLLGPTGPSRDDILIQMSRAGVGASAPFPGQAEQMLQPLVNLPTLTGKTVSDAKDVAGRAIEATLGLYGGDPAALMDAAQGLGGPSIPPTPAEKNIAAVLNVSNRAASSMTSPAAIAALATGMTAPSIVGRLIAGGFGTQMALESGAQAEKAGEVSVTGSTQDKIEAYGDLALTAAFTALAGTHAATPEKIDVVRDALKEKGALTPERAEFLDKLQEPYREKFTETVSEAPESIATILADSGAPETAKAVLESTVEEPKPSESTVPQEAGMGGATPSEFRDKTAIDRLTRTVEFTDTPEQSLGERLQLRKRFADTIEAGKDAFEKTKTLVQEIPGAIVNAITEAPEWTDFKSTLGESLGAKQKSDLATRRFAETIKEKVKDPVASEAIINWIEADGDNALLLKRAAEVPERWRSGYERATQLTPDEKYIAESVRDYLADQLDKGIEAGTLKNGVDEYITHIWKQANPISGKLSTDVGMGTLRTDFKFAKQRVFETYFEGEKAGYAPLKKDLGFLISAYDQAFNHTLINRQFVAALRKGTASDGRPLVELSGIRNVIENPDADRTLLIKPRAKTADVGDYKEINHPALRAWKWADTDEAGNTTLYHSDFLVHPEIYSHLNNVLKRSALRENPVTAAVMKGQYFLKATKMSASLFHQGQEGAHALFHRVNPFSVEPINLDNPVQYKLVTHNLKVADFNALQEFSEGLGGGGGLLGKIPGMGEVLQRYQNYLFRDYIPNLKMKMAQVALERNMDRFKGKLSEDQIYELTANQANAAFGELNYKAMGRSPTTQDFFRMVALAPDFLEARGRFVAQAFTKYGTEQRHALALMAATLYIGARILNKVLDDDYHWNKPFTVIAKGKEYGFRTLVQDVQHGVTDPRNFLYNRLSPISRTGIEAVTGRNDRGIKRSSWEQMQDFLSWFKPISLDKKDDTTTIEQILSSTGVSARPYRAENDVYQMARDFNKKSKDPATQRLVKRQESEAFAESDYKKLDTALRMGDAKEAKKAYQELVDQGRSEKVIANRFKQMPKRPFTWAKSRESEFIDSMSPEEKKLYDRAIAEREELVRKFEELKKD